MLRISRYELIEWDSPEVDDDPKTNNLLHCQQPGHLGPQAEQIVYQVFYDDLWVEVEFRVQTAQYAVVGVALSDIWLVLLKDSETRGDWLRPVTGWPAERAQISAWERGTGQIWRGRRR